MSSRCIRQLWRFLLVATAILTVSLAVVACGDAKPAAVPTEAAPPTNTPAPAPTETPIPPTDTPVPPTDTPVPPTDTPAPSPTKAAEAAQPFAAQPGAQEMSEEDKARAKALAEGMAKRIGLQDFHWEAWILPPDITWDDTLSYYDRQATEKGWSPDVSNVGDIEGGKFAVVGETKTQTMLVIIWVKNEKQNRVEVLTLFGKIPAAKSAEPTATPKPPTAEPTKTPEQAAPPATPAQQAPANASGFDVPAGKALFVFYNYTNVDWNVDIGPNLLKVPANQPGQEFAVGTMALEPGTYTWQANSPGGGWSIKDANGNVAFEFTVTAGDVYVQGVR